MISTCEHLLLEPVEEAPCEEGQILDVLLQVVRRGKPLGILHVCMHVIICLLVMTVDVRNQGNTNVRQRVW